MGNKLYVRRTDPGVATFRGALESLIESLDATVRIARWEAGAEPIPDPLSEAATKLQQRLGTAIRLAAGTFHGAPAVVASTDAMKEAARGLDAAFVAYCKRVDGGRTQEAVLDLDAELGRFKRDAHRWQ